MGKTGRWFKSLLGGKKKGESPATTSVSDSKPAKEKNRWSFVRSFRDKTRSVSVPVTGDEKRRSYRENSSYSYVDDIDQTKHAIAVAAATAAVAEAALAAAQAATAVVRLTNSRRCTTAYVSGSDRKREYLAVVKIQASFRGYLARRALMALKGLVKLQALVRGHIVRKKTAEKLRYMQGLVPVQARKQAGRGLISDYGYPIKQQSSLPHRHRPHSSPSTPENREHMIRSKSSRIDHSMTLKRNESKSSSRYGIDHNPTQFGSNRRSHWVEERSSDHLKEDEKHDKILEIDMGKPRYNSKPRNIYHFRHHSFSSDRISHSFTTLDSPSKDSTIAQQSIPSSSSGEVRSSRPQNFHHNVDDTVFGTANNSPQCSAKRGPFTPTRSDTQSFLIGYSDNPNYMANTKSSRAKVRPQSVPKQRLEFGKCGSINRVPIHGFSDVRSSAQRASALHLSFTDKTYPGSGRLDRFGMPIRDRGVY